MTDLRETPPPAATPDSAAIEALADELHTVYYHEAVRQGDVRHSASYDALPENIKEFDRVLARFILAREFALRAEVERLTPKATRSGGNGIDVTRDPYHNAITGCLCNHCQNNRGYYVLGDAAERRVAELERENERLKGGNDGNAV